MRLRGKRLALRAIVIIVVHYRENDASGDSMKGEKAFAFVRRRACTVGSGLCGQKRPAWLSLCLIASPSP